MLKKTIRILSINSCFLALIIGCGVDKQTKRNEEMLGLDSISQLYHSGQIDACIKQAGSFTSKYPNNDAGWHVLGSAHLLRNEDSLAYTFSRRSLNINSKNHIALLCLGILFDKEGETERAKQHYQESLESNPNIAQTYSHYASNRLFGEDYLEAIRLGSIAIEMADNINDKAILCASYHKAGLFIERDSLYHILKQLEYVGIEDLRELFN